MNMSTPPIDQGLLFFGNQHETVPTRLLFDPYLTSRAKLAWQLIKYKAREFQAGLFPSYETLSKLLSDKTYAEGQLSRKLVSQTLLLLRLTRWLTLCETVRNEQGQVMGNVYLLHDEPMPVIDTIQLNNDYLRLLESAVKHQDPTVRGVANHIVDNLMSDTTQWHYVSHIDWMRARLQAFKSRTKTNEKITPEQQKQLTQLQQTLLSSHKELGQPTLSSARELSKNDRELSKVYLSSKKELSQQNETKSLISGLVPNGNSVNSPYSTSTICINKYCTGRVEEIPWTAQVEFSPLEKQAIAQTMKGLDLGICKALLFELEQRAMKGEVKKPQGYLMTLIQRAHRGEFKPYHYQHSFAKETAEKSTALSQNEHHSMTQNMIQKTLTQEERLARSESMRLFRERLGGY